MDDFVIDDSEVEIFYMNLIVNDFMPMRLHGKLGFQYLKERGSHFMD